MVTTEPDSDAIMEFNIRETIIMAIMVLFLGKYLNQRIPILRSYNIPEPETGAIPGPVADELAAVDPKHPGRAADRCVVYRFEQCGDNRIFPQVAGLIQR